MVTSKKAAAADHLPVEFLPAALVGRGIERHRYVLMRVQARHHVAEDDRKQQHQALEDTGVERGDPSREQHLLQKHERAGSEDRSDEAAAAPLSGVPPSATAAKVSIRNGVPADGLPVAV